MGPWAGGMLDEAEDITHVLWALCCGLDGLAGSVLSDLGGIEGSGDADRDRGGCQRVVGLIVGVEKAQ